MLYRIENLWKRRPGENGYRLLVRSLRISPGERVAITGPSGCGKSTVLDILGLALRPDAADVFEFAPAGAGICVLPLWEAGKLDALAALRLENMGYVLQSGELLPYLTVLENMELSARLMGADQGAAEARRLAEELGIAHLFGAMPNTLSFGERQRAAIVRALAGRPKVILADEPTASLDPLHADIVMRAFLEAIGRNGATLILVTHNVPWARAAGLRELSFTLETGGDGLTAILDDGAAGGARPC